MRIEILGAPEVNVIAREVQIQGGEGNFHLRLNGHVMYRSPVDGTERSAGRSIDVFAAAVEAWNTYSDEMVGAATDQDELVVFERLRSRLNELDLFQDGEAGYWDHVVAQAQESLL